VRDLLHAKTDVLPADRIVAYLAQLLFKMGRDYSDYRLE